MFGYGSKLMLSGWLNTMYSQLSPLIIGRFYSSSTLGYYTRAQSYVDFPSSNIMGILQQVVFPVLSRLQNEDEQLIGIYRKYIKVCAIFIFCGMTILAALAKPLILLLLLPNLLPYKRKPNCHQRRIRHNCSYPSYGRRPCSSDGRRLFPHCCYPKSILR